MFYNTFLLLVCNCRVFWVVFQGINVRYVIETQWIESVEAFLLTV